MAPRPGSALAIPPDTEGLRAALLAWFDRDGRALAFRFAQDPDPWAVLVSEVMAQQTQVGRVAERWREFLDRFPTPATLAAAPTGDVIRAWRGLGYNRRAIDLQRAAREIVAAGGDVPGDVNSLMALPGVGPYTARAVAAIAFGRPVGAVDVNVRRVVSRLAGAGVAPAPERTLQAAADSLVDPDRAGDWTHALMDLGATICRPARPACDGCPVRAWCAFPGAERMAAGHTTAGAKAPGAHGAMKAQEAAQGGLAVMPATSSAGPATSRRGRADRAPRVAVPFEATTRWLRGRIVDRLCSVPRGTGVAFDGPLGTHSAAAVAAALAALAADGLVEVDGGGTARLAGELA